MTRSGCTTCGGYGNRHDPIAHDAEPTWTTCPTCGGSGANDSYDGATWDVCTTCNGDGEMEP